MSAFIVDKDHIDAMVAAGLRHTRCGTFGWSNAEGVYDGTLKLDLNTANRVGQMLWAENVASVEHRYSPPGREETYGEGFESSPDFQLPGKYNVETIPGSTETMGVPEWLSEYRYCNKVRTPSPVEALKLVDCYEYQSCEHEGWEGSEANHYCEALRSTLICALPGYDEAAWSA